MPRKIVILSGSVGSGKTTLAENLIRRFGEDARLFKTRQFLKERGGIKIASERGALQAFGEKLDKQTKGRWVCDDFIQAIKPFPKTTVVVLDALRMRGQIDAIRQAYGQNVFHIHLKANIEELRKRYATRPSDEIQELASYDAVLENKTERNVPKLENIADVVIETDRCTAIDVLIRAASHIGLFGREYLRLVDVLVGGQYGSEGKGQVTAYLSPEYQLLVRVGGPNAGHKVWEWPEPYAFHQLPSGTRKCGANLLIGAGAVINVQTLLREIAECDVEPKRLTIDPQAMIISSDDLKKEGRLIASIGSTGQGVGAATARRIMGRSGNPKVFLARDIPELRPFTTKTAREVLEDAFDKRWRVLLEGTQGTGLSLFHGRYPHVTSRDTTVAGCLAEAGISPSRVQKVIMVCRSYPIRVESPKDGDSGYMSQPITWDLVSQRSKIPVKQLLELERTTTTKRQRRVAEFDWDLLRMAATLNAPTDIGLSFVDYISPINARAKRFEQLTPETIRFVEEVEKVASAPVTLVSTGFNERSVIDRRMW
jgi:adenylosuccinate synthase